MMIVASTILVVLAVGVTVGLVGFLASEPSVDLSGWFGRFQARISRTARQSVLMPFGFFAFAIVGGASYPIYGVGVAQTLPAARAEAEEPVRTQGDHMTEDMVTRIATQGGAAAVLLVVLWSYRRDFLRKLDDKEREIRERHEETETLREVLDRSTTAIANSVNATTNQTVATIRLSQAVENIERKVH